MKPDYSGLLVPPPPVSEIHDGLFQGVRPDSYIGYDLAISVEQHLARKPMDGYMGAVMHIGLVDDDLFPLDSYRMQFDAAVYAAGSVLEDGGKVLVHCSGGLNRSSVVTVEILVRHWLMERREAVALLRDRRDPYCLCNRAFERWSLREPLPTAETSVFRQVPDVV